MKRQNMYLYPVLFALFIFSSAGISAQISPQQLLRSSLEKKIQNIIDSTDGVVGVTINDLVTGESFSINGDMVFTQASAIKLEVLHEVFRQAKAGKYSLDDLVTMEESDVTRGSGNLQALTPGKVTMSIRDYLTMMIMISDNTATNMMIELAGMDNVNNTLAELGLNSTKLQRRMLDSQAVRENRENISTPNDAARLLGMIYNAETLDRESCDEMLRILSIPKSSRIRMLLPRGTKVAHKTGTVSGVVCDIGIVYLKNRPFIVAGMANWLNDSREGEQAIAEIALAAYTYFDRIANSNKYGHKY